MDLFDTLYLEPKPFQAQIDAINTILAKSNAQAKQSTTAKTLTAGRAAYEAKQAASRSNAEPQDQVTISSEATARAGQDAARTNIDASPSSATIAQKQYPAVQAAKQAQAHTDEPALEKKNAELTEQRLTNPSSQQQVWQAALDAMVRRYRATSDTSAAAPAAEPTPSKPAPSKVEWNAAYVEPAPSKFDSDGHAYLNWNKSLNQYDESTGFGLAMLMEGRQYLGEMEGAVAGYNRKVAYYASDEYLDSLPQTHDLMIKTFGQKEGERRYQFHLSLPGKAIADSEETIARDAWNLQDLYNVTGGAMPVKGEDGLYQFDTLQLTSKSTLSGNSMPYKIVLDQDYNAKISVNGKDISDLADITDYRNDKQARNNTHSAATSLSLLYQYVDQYNQLVQTNVSYAAQSAAESADRAAFKDAYVALNGEEAYENWSQPRTSDQDLAETDAKVQKELQYINDNFAIEGEAPAKRDDGTYAMADFALTASGGGYSADTPDKGWHVRVSTLGEVETVASGEAVAAEGYVPMNMAQLGETRTRVLTNLLKSAPTPVKRTNEIRVVHCDTLTTYRRDGSASVETFAWATDHVESKITTEIPATKTEAP